MAHWGAVLPGRRLLDFLGPPFDQRCIDFHKTERRVRTASSEQVRRPIFKDGIDQWQNFDPRPGPPRDALGSPGTTGASSGTDWVVCAWRIGGHG